MQVHDSYFRNHIASYVCWQPAGRLSLGVNAILLVGAGFFVNGPYALITTAVSADLGTHKSIEGEGVWLIISEPNMMVEQSAAPHSLLPHLANSSGVHNHCACALC